MVLKVETSSKNAASHDETTEQCPILFSFRAMFAIYKIPEQATSGSRYQVEKAANKFVSQG